MGVAAEETGVVISLKILPDKKVTFRLLAPKAGNVVLNGNWDQGTNIAMTRDAQGIWSVTVGPLGEQLWGYSFSVDGLKVLDPGNGEYQRDGNRYDNLLMISGPASDLWEFKPGVPHGAVTAVWYPSPTTDRFACLDVLHARVGLQDTVLTVRDDHSLRQSVEDVAVGLLAFSVNCCEFGDPRPMRFGAD